MIVEGYYFLALIVGIAAALLAIVAFSQESLVLVGVYALGGFLGVVSYVAAAELIKVFLDTEENIRNCYFALRQILNKQ